MMRTRDGNTLHGGSHDYAGAMEHLVDVVRQLSLAKNLDAVVEIVRHEARILTGADGAAVIVRDGDFSFYVDEDAIAPLWKNTRIPLSACVSGWAMTNRKMVVIKDVYNDPRVAADLYRSTFVRSLVMVPICTADPIGAIGIYWAKQCEPTEEQLKLVQALADATAAAMDSATALEELEERVQERTTQLEAANREIRQLALKDTLTGLYNRKGFILLAAQQLEVAMRSHETAWLMLSDIDGLKPVNDGLGREAGDRMLLAASRVLREAFRGSDVIARVGGDEFAIFGVSNPHPADFAERLQLYIDAHNETSEEEAPLSMCIGLAVYRLAEKPTLDDLLKKAEDAIARSRRTRRNLGSVAHS